MIIGIAGKMGCGKDYICNNYLAPILKQIQRNFLQISFADQLKVNMMTKNNISFDSVYINKTKDTRKLLQIEGTECGRETLGDDIWIRYLDNWVNVYKSRGVQDFICTDVRFINEVNYIRNGGGIIIRIDAPKRNLDRLLRESCGDLETLNVLKNHVSECDLDILSDNDFDLIIQNDVEHSIPSEDEFLKIYKMHSVFNKLKSIPFL